MNDPTFVEASRALAERVIREQPTDAERIEWLFRWVVSRPPKPRESESLARMLERSRNYFAENPQAAARRVKVGVAPRTTAAPVEELAAWSEAARVVLNLHESITRY